MQLISDKSPAAGLHALAEREAALIVIGSSHRSNIGRSLVGGTGERLLSGASAPVAVAPVGSTLPRAGSSCWGTGSTARRRRGARSHGRPSSRGQRRRGYVC